jgi:hypothetical protein
MKRVYHTPVESLGEYLNNNEIKYKRKEISGSTFVSQIGETERPSLIYPNVLCNNHLNNLLTNTGYFKGLFDPLEFFNLLYEQLELVLENLESREASLEVLLHFDNLTWDKRKLYLILGSLHYLSCHINNSSYWMLPPYYHYEIEDDTKSGILEWFTHDLDVIVSALYGELYMTKGTEIIYDFLPNIRGELSFKKFKPTLNDKPKKELSGIPIFNPEAIDTIYNLLKGFFSEQQRPQFKSIMLNGSIACEPLNFLDHGNRLAHALKQLKEKDIITGCTKIQLEAWIWSNFSYISKNHSEKFKLDYLNTIISTTKPLCKNPLLKVEIDKQTGEYIITKP